MWWSEEINCLVEQPITHGMVVMQRRRYRREIKQVDEHQRLIRQAVQMVFGLFFMGNMSFCRTTSYAAVR